MAIQISSNRLPISGKDFHFTVSSESRTEIVVSIKGRTVYRVECPDPPCHEMFRVPAEAGSESLIIEAINEAKEVAREQIMIRAEATT